MIQIQKVLNILNKDKNIYSTDEAKLILDFLTPIVEILVDYIEINNNKGEK